MGDVKVFTIEEFAKIDDVVYSKSAKEARNKAFDLAGLFTDGRFQIPNEEEFAGIIKPKEEV